MARDVCPSADLNESLGAANQRWKKVYVGEVVEEESNFISRLVTKLASKAAISVSSLSKESIFYRLLSYAFDASGVEYNFNNANAWYICFGDLLGGLIIQGGYTPSYADNLDIYIAFPLSFTQVVSVHFAGDITLVGGTQAIQNVKELTFNYVIRETSHANIGGWWLAIGQ